MQEEVANVLAKEILEFLKNGERLPTLEAWGPALLVHGPDYVDEYLQLYGKDGTVQENGFNRALIVRHARYIAACVNSASGLAQRVIELEEENVALRTDLDSRLTHERIRQMRAKSKRMWETITRLEFELDIWKQRVDREQNITEEFRERMNKAEELVKKGIEQFTTANEYLKGFDCEKNCDPSVGFHQSECAISYYLSEWLYEAETLLKEKEVAIP